MAHSGINPRRQSISTSCTITCERMSQTSALSTSRTHVVTIWKTSTVSSVLVLTLKCSTIQHLTFRDTPLNLYAQLTADLALYLQQATSNIVTAPSVTSLTQRRLLLRHYNQPKRVPKTHPHSSSTSAATSYGQSSENLSYSKEVQCQQNTQEQNYCFYLRNRSSAYAATTTWRLYAKQILPWFDHSAKDRHVKP